MNFTYMEEISNVHYALRLRLKADALFWDSSRGTQTLIVCCPYKSYPFDDMASFCSALSRENITDSKYSVFEWKGESFYARFASFGEDLKGVDIFREACSYVILACSKDDENVVVYPPNPARDQRKDVPLEVDLKYEADTAIVKSGLFSTKSVPTGFWIFYTNKLNIREYKDGDVFYKIGDWQIPITTKMLEAPIYIKSSDPPEFRSSHTGLDIVTNRIK